MNDDQDIADEAPPSPALPLLTLKIDSVAYGGKGVARSDSGPVPAAGDAEAPEPADIARGKVWFVAGAIEGETVKARIIEDKGRYGEAVAVETVVPGPWRGPSPCPHSVSCGGCDWQGVPAARQAEWKRQFVAAALTRIGKLAPGLEVGFEAPAATLHYRNRILVRLHHDAGARTVRLGYFQRGTHTLTPIGACALAAPAINRVLAGLLDQDLSAFPEFKARLELQQLPAVPEDGGTVVVTVYPAEGPRAASGDLAGLLRAMPGVGWAELVFELQRAEMRVFDRDLGITFYTRPGLFQQVNPEMNRRLRRHIKAVVDAKNPGRILDVCCGAGNLSLPLADGRRHLEGVESSRPAIECAERSAREKGVPATYLAGDAERHLWKCDRGGERFDLVLLDPPRQGLRGGMVPLKNIDPDTIIYVACDPTTLARDLSYLCRRDAYVIERVTAYDFFPNTYHVETVVELRRQR